MDLFWLRRGGRPWTVLECSYWEFIPLLHGLSEVWAHCSVNSTRDLLGHTSSRFFSFICGLVFLNLNAFSMTLLSSICVPLSPLILMCLMSVHALFLFIYIQHLVPWISWMITLSTLLLHCPWKHIHNHQSLHSDLWSGRHCHYTYAIPQPHLVRSCFSPGHVF